MTQQVKKIILIGHNIASFMLLPFQGFMEAFLLYRFGRRAWYFVNTHGLPGKNIAGDLYMEHLNRLAKDAIKNLGANKTERAIEWVGKAIRTIAPLLQHFDMETNIKQVSGTHEGANMDKDTGK